MFPSLRSSFTLLLLIALALSLQGLSATSASAQVPTGTPPFGSFSGGPDVINLANLNSHITVPVLNKAGRGTNFTYDLSYDASVWYPVTSGSTTSWQPVFNWGWNVQTAVATGYLSANVTQYRCYDSNHIPGLRITTSNWAYHDMFGVAHLFAGSTVEYDGCPGTTTSLNTLATDGSGYNLQVTGGGPGILISPVGKVIHAPQGSSGPSPSGASSFTDRNGNKITDDGSGHFYDTLSSTTPAITVSTAAPSPTVPVTLTYTPPSGGSASYSIKYSAYTVQTAFGCSLITDYGPTTNNLISEIDLPDISVNPSDKYTFTYETTPGDAHNPHYVTGRLISVTLPTGGTITYAYTGGSTGNITCADGSASGLTRQTPDGTWNYTRTAETAPAYVTKVTDPQNNDTLIQFQGIYETQRDIYQGAAPSFSTFPIPESTLQTSNLLQETPTCYNTFTTACTNTAITLPIGQRTITTKLSGAASWANAQTSQHIYKYSSSGSLTEQDDYDYGIGIVGALLAKTTITYATLTNITSFRQQVTVTNGSSTVAQTNYNYGDTVTATSGTPQHTTPPGSRGNLLSINYYTHGTSYLTQSMSHFDTGNVQTVTDINGAVTTLNYADANNTCGNAFPTSVSEPLSLTRYMTWSCTGGVQLTAKDENGQTTTTTYNDQYFWRPVSATDPLTNVTSMAYGSNPAWIVRSLTFNANQSIAYTGTGFDGLGRVVLQSRQQSPSGTAWDQVTQSYDSNGRPWKTSVPCVNTGAWTCPNTATTTTYDALNRPLLTTDGGGGTINYSYSQNDVLVAVGPPPTGENTKRRQLEYDALGRLTSVCEMTTATGSGTCGQRTTQTGFWTKYTYDALGNLTGVSQNAQGTAQTRSYTFDLRSRLTSETNPESGTTSYIYDTMGASSCNSAYTSNGDLIRKADANGTNACYYYDSLHRLTDAATAGPTANGCKRFRYDNTTGVLGSRPSGVSLANALSRLAEAETDTCAWPITQSSIITDEWFSYTARGEVSDLYESTPHSGGYSHSAATYWANGAANQLTAPGGYAAQYNLDGEGRVYSTAPSVNALSSTLYNAASQPTQITYASSDSDTFTYDPYTNRMTQYKFNVNGQSVIGNLTWNPIGTLASLAITDPFNSANTQTCNYSHDDLTRIASANCGSAANQTFSYDAFGNINKSGSPYSFQPTYNSSTNRMTSISGSTPTYDASGNVLNDFLHSYTWNAYGHPSTIDGVSVTYDALGRAVEQNRSGVYSEIGYAPTGDKIEIMNGQSFTKAFVPLPGGAVAVYTPSLEYYRHPDHLGSSRFASTLGRTMYSDVAYAPFGEPYAQTGSTDLSFTGQTQDTASNLYDFPAREYGIQGRWPSPDPAGLAATDLTDPQSWNRYAYVLNNPLTYVDPLGLYTIFLPNGAGGGCSYDEVDFFVDGQYQSSDFSFIGCEGSDANRLKPQQLPHLPPLKCDPNKFFSCADTAGYRVTQGVLGVTNLTLAGVKTAGLAETDALLAVTAPESGGGTLVAAAGVTTYGVLSIQGQTVSGMGQLFSAITGDAKGGEGITQIGDILAGPIAGITTLIKTGDPSLAQRNANIENTLLAGPGLVNGQLKEKIISAVDLGLGALGLSGAGCHP
jgi:RHS repeat-associated protein